MTSAISSAVKASTHEGVGRYIVKSIEVNLAGDPNARECTVKLVKPTAPLPERRAGVVGSTAAKQAGVSAAGMPKGIAAAISECERIDAKHYPYSTPGSRGTPPPANGPYDCSGVVSRILYVACGAPPTSLASQELTAFGEPGEGEWLTVWAKGPNGPTGHALLHIRTQQGWRYFATSGDNPGGGAGWVPDSYYGPGYFAPFTARHPHGL